MMPVGTWMTEGISLVARIRGSILNLYRILRDVLREIFDESAYDRYRQRNDCAASRESYAAFRRDTESEKARRPRCC